MKRFFMIIALCLVLTSCTKTTQPEPTRLIPDKDGYFALETVNLVYAYMEVFPEARDKERVLSLLNDITKDRINVTVTIESYPPSTVASKIDLKLASHQQIDIFSTLNGSRIFESLVARNAVAPLNDLLLSHGNNLLNNNDDNLIKLNDVTYGIAYNDSNFGYYCLFINAEMAKRFGVEDMIKKVKRFEDMEYIYKIVHEKDPSIKCYIPSGYGGMAFQGYRVTEGIKTIESLGDYLGVILNNDNYNVVNLYETAEYAEILKMARRFYLQGYIPHNAAYTDVNRDLQYQSLEGFSVINYRRALKSDEPFISELHGIESWVIPLNQLFINTHKFGIAINAASEYKEAAMAWLDLVTTDEDIYHLLAYGIEGEHYQKNENGTICLPEGCNSLADTGYETSHYFTIGEIRNRLVWEAISNDPDYYRKLSAHKNEAIYSNTFGFTYDNRFVSTEVEACKKVTKKYLMALETGALDPETELPKFIAELKSAGIDAIIKEKQRQLDIWLKKP